MRLYLDTNVFAHAHDEGVGEQLVRWSQARRIDVLISEVHVGEALAIKDEAMRTARIDLLASLPARWLAPPGYLQSQELVAEIRRLRSNWRRLPVGDESLSRALLASHREGWRLVKRRDLASLERIHQPYREVEEPAIAGSRGSQKVMREHLRGGQPTTSEVVLGGQHFEIRPPLDLSNLDGFCRFESLAAWWGALFGRQPTLADYANHSEPYLDLARVGQADFVTFWVKDVDLRRLPRGLSSSAVVFGQLEARITHGNPADVRHASFLPDATLFATEDQVFRRAMALAARELNLREPVFISRGQPLLDQLEAAVGDAGRGRQVG
jgi:hypothetical protein